MQSVKDSLYIALRDRLAALDPTRVVLVNGASRSAVLVSENEPGTSAPQQPSVFYLTFGKMTAMPGSAARRPTLRLEVAIQYRTFGSADQLGVDRGRSLGALDLELAQILAPHNTPKKDYTQTPPADLGSVLTWTAPEFMPAEARDGGLLRTVRIIVFFSPEVDLP